MKKTATVLLALTILAGCSTNDGKSVGSTNTTTTSTTNVTANSNGEKVNNSTNTGSETNSSEQSNAMNESTTNEHKTPTNETTTKNESNTTEQPTQQYEEELVGVFLGEADGHSVEIELSGKSDVYNVPSNLTNDVNELEANGPISFNFKTDDNGQKVLTFIHATKLAE